MRRAIILATAGLGLAGCGSVSMPSLDLFKSTPPSMALQLESLPPGAEARTSLGPSCRTPCAVSIPRTENFTVTFTLDRYLPQTVPVRLVEPQLLPDSGGDDGPVSPVQEATFDPSPVYVELQAAPPPRRPAPKAPPKRVTAPPPAAAAPPPPPARAPSSSPFPPPTSSPFPSPR